MMMAAVAGRGQEQGAYAKESSSVVERLQTETPEQRTSTGKTQQDAALPPHSPFREEVDEFRRKKHKKLLSPSRSLSFSSSHAPSLRPSTQLLAEAAKPSRQKRGVARSLSSISPSSSLGLRLASKTHECLQEAEQCSGKEREGLLHLLLASLSAQVEEGLLSYIPDCDFGPVEEQQENQRCDFFAQGNSFALSPSSAGSSLHYYQLLASYYARSNSSFVELLSFLQRSSLWSSKPFPQIFACLFYRKLLQGEEWKESVQRSCHSHTAIGSWTLRTPRGMHVFLKGTNRLFWQDLESGTTCFLPIFQLIKTEVLLSRRLWKENAIKKTLFDVFFLICRFFWYYENAYRRIVVESESNSNNNTSSFLDFISGVDANLDATLLQEVPLPKRFSAYNLLVRMQQGKEGEKAAVEGPENGSDGCMTAYSQEHWEENRDYTNKEEADEVTDNTLLDMPLLDVFVESIVQQIAFIKNEKILVTYLRHCALLKDHPIGSITSVKLQTGLYGFQQAGGPLYPTRNVRRAARQVVDCLWPHGKISRRAIGLLFRLLHPYYGTTSILYWTWYYIAAVLSFILSLFLMCWRVTMRSTAHRVFLRRRRPRECHRREE